MPLAEEIDAKRRSIRTDAYSMSISEWGSLYENKEIDIHPEFQRFFRWTDIQKTSLIESLLLGIPIPPIFVSQRKDGVWDVVDGLQRLSTLYQFMGILKDENGANLAPFSLKATKYLPSLQNMAWNNPADPENSFSHDLRLLIKRAKISVSIILKESDESAKYDLFQRLNTGGSNLTEQEVRNCILVMLNRDAFLWLKSIAEYEPFQTCIALSDRPLEEAYDLELALRFVLLYDKDPETLQGIQDMGEYITNLMTRAIQDGSLNMQAAEAVFRRTFDLLSRTIGSDAFRRFSPDKNKHLGGFLLSQFEAVAFGVAHNIERAEANPEQIAQKIQSLWTNSAFTDWARSGVAVNRRLYRLFKVGRETF